MTDTLLPVPACAERGSAPLVLKTREPRAAISVHTDAARVEAERWLDDRMGMNQGG